MNLPDDEPQKVEVACCLRLDQAENRSLVLQAMGIAFWIVFEEGLYRLLVEPDDAEAAMRELRADEEERRAEREARGREGGPDDVVPKSRASFLSLLVYAWAMAGFFLLQARESPGWTLRGEADSTAILHGEAWRVVTALTLHGDTGHLLANLLVGLLFAAALLPALGSGWTWLGFVLSGALGNALNAWGYRGEAHHSIGASTAVFGALGMLVGWQVFALLRHAGSLRKARLRDLAFPVAAGLGLLAYLGTGSGTEETRVDLSAHLFGMLAGVAIGAVLAWARLPERTSPGMQKALAGIALLLPCLAWWMAWR